MLIEKLASHR